jgi:hypothetical protein
MAVGLACAALACAAPASAGEYTATRALDAPFAFPSIFGGTFNKGSSLVREAIILNDPDCPVQISKTATAFELAKSNFALVAATDFTLKSPTAAISIRHVAFDVFGQHMENLVATDVSDRKPGPHSRTTRWSALGDLIPEMLTTVTYVARVRLSDGTQWSYDESKLLAALARLKLEARLGDSRVLEAGRPE